MAKIVTAKEFSFREVRSRSRAPASKLFVQILSVLPIVLEEEYARAATLENEVIPRVEPAIREITNRLGLELYGIDCSLNPDGTMIVFEANANMNFMTNSHPQMNERMDMITDRLHALLVRYSGEQVI